MGREMPSVENGRIGEVTGSVHEVVWRLGIAT
jgi:hypothetical protein